MSLTITGLLIAVLSQFIPAEDAQTVVSAIGIILAFWGRIRIGDVNWFGIRK